MVICGRQEVHYIEQVITCNIYITYISYVTQPYMP